MSKNSGLNLPGIYTITHVKSGKVYVGQTNSVRLRFQQHRRDLRKGKHRNFLLQRAWNKHGAGAFIFAVHVDLSGTPAELLTVALNDAERAALPLFKLAYNLMEVGEAGGLANAATRKIWSDQRKKMWADPEFRAKRSADMKAMYANNPEWKAERDAAVKASRSTDAAKAATSIQSTALWQSEEHRTGQSAKRAANWQDPAYVAQQSASRTKSWADPDSRKRRIAALNKAASNPSIKAARTAGVNAVRDQISESQKTAWQDPLVRQRIIDGQKAGWARRKARLAKQP